MGGGATLFSSQWSAVIHHEPSGSFTSRIRRLKALRAGRQVPTRYGSWMVPPAPVSLCGQFTLFDGHHPPRGRQAYWFPGNISWELALGGFSHPEAEFTNRDSHLDLVGYVWPSCCLVLERFKTSRDRGSWVVQSVKRLTLEFGLGHDLMICGIEPHIGFCADSMQPAWDPLSLSLSLPLLCLLPLKINKYTLQT